jgi:hypothetical protein
MAEQYKPLSGPIIDSWEGWAERGSPESGVSHIPFDALHELQGVVGGCIATIRALQAELRAERERRGEADAILRSWGGNITAWCTDSLLCIVCGCAWREDHRDDCAQMWARDYLARYEQQQSGGASQN